MFFVSLSFLICGVIWLADLLFLDQPQGISEVKNTQQPKNGPTAGGEGATIGKSIAAEIKHQNASREVHKAKVGRKMDEKRFKI